MNKSINILRNLKYKNGLFSASSKKVDTGYNKVWIRDNIYEAIGLEHADIKEALKTYHALLNILIKHEDKIDWAIKEKPDAAFKYIHPRYDPDTMKEIWEEWGNKQNDAIGALLFKIGEMLEKNLKIIRGIDDYRIIQKLIIYLESIEYWHDQDNGIWEENEEVHASSIGACVAGLKKLSKYFHIPHGLIEKGIKKLNILLPRESITKEVDLALLSLIYPFNIVDKNQRNAILQNVENKLVRNNGVIRYIGDQYYNKKGEAEWCFGFPWLAIIYKKLGNKEKYRFYINKTLSVMNKKGELPELYYANSKNYNENCPLGWAQALYIVAKKI